MIYEFKDIYNWDALKELFNLEYYSLDQNYRNTLQITEYCNDEFGIDIYPIGITGSKVIEKTLEDSLEELIRIKEDNPHYRVALIKSYKYSKDDNAIKKGLGENEISWLKIDNNKISIVTVELAKGLEFDAVAVLTEKMSVNEKYISFTRAMDNLIVIK